MPLLPLASVDLATSLSRSPDQVGGNHVKNRRRATYGGNATGDWRAKQLFFEHQLQELLVVFQVSLS